MCEFSQKIQTVITRKFLNDAFNLRFEDVVIHHADVTGEIIDYAHNFCNKKVSQTQNLIPVFVQNLFSFDFFFVVKGIRLCVWRTEQLNIGGMNLINVQYANICDQVKFIDTVIYDQQFLTSLVSSGNELEKSNIR